MTEAAAPPNPDAVFTPGIRNDISHADYLSIPAFSATAAKIITARSPLHLKAGLDDDDTTPSLSMGTALHMAILEPARFETDVVASPPFDKRTKAGKADAEAFALANRGRLVLTEAEWSRVAGMAASVRRHRLFSDLFTLDGQREVTFQWHDARLGIPCKARFDFLRPDGIAIDLKTARDASPDGFARACAQHRYHLQHAHYLTGHETLLHRSLDAFLFFAVESEAPYACAIYTLQSNAVRFALDAVERAMLQYAQALKTGFWPGYTETIQPVIMPRWSITLQTPEGL